MITLRESRADELEAFSRMDQHGDTHEHINAYSLAEHRREFARDDLVYLSIENEAQLVGYFILALEADPGRVEFRRIVIAARGQGYGQAAILAMEAYCRDRLQRHRLWLDVYESNPRGQHIYRKLGYRQFDSSELNGRKLLLMEKTLRADNADPT